MKSFTLSRLVAVAGGTLLLALLTVSQASAANPLNQPRGLALAANGNLYVANQGGNNIVVFNPNYAQVTSKTITAGIDDPSGVAIDSLGNIYVSNLGNGQVTEYSSAGVQNTAATIYGVISEEGIAVDGIGNIYVDSGYQTIPVYSANSINHMSTPVLVENYTPPSDAFCIAARDQFFAFGSVSNVQAEPLNSVIQGNTNGRFTVSAAEVLSCAFDTSDDVYYGDTNNNLNRWSLAAGSAGQVASLGFTPEGIAVDSTRGRIYVSNQQGNSIAVYSTSGTLLKTIE